MPHRQTNTISLSAKEAIAFLLNQGMSREALRHALEEVASESTTDGSSVFTLDVDYAKTKLQMIRAGNYGYVNDFLRDNDPVEGKIAGSGTVSVRLELVHFNRVISASDALFEIKKRGLVPAGIEHLLALGVNHPNLQKEFPIVALGSVWQGPGGRRYVACLLRWSDEHKLTLDWYDFDWRERCRFLVVGK